MVNEWGMLPGSGEAYLVSQQQKDAAVQSWLSQAQQMASEVIERHHAAWQKLTEKLLDEETVDGKAVMECF